LLRDGLSGEETFSEADAATLARCAGVVDFARLDADITAAARRVRGWYRRLIEEPARRVSQQTAEDTGESAG
jgi:glutathione S-transferase